MLWIKGCVVPTLSHEVLVTDVVYPVILFSYGYSLNMFWQWWAAFEVGYRY